MGGRGWSTRATERTPGAISGLLGGSDYEKMSLPVVVRLVCSLRDWIGTEVAP